MSVRRRTSPLPSPCANLRLTSAISSSMFGGSRSMSSMKSSSLHGGVAELETVCRKPSRSFSMTALRSTGAVLTSLAASSPSVRRASLSVSHYFSSPCNDGLAGCVWSTFAHSALAMTASARLPTYNFETLRPVRHCDSTTAHKYQHTGSRNDTATLQSARLSVRSCNIATRHCDNSGLLVERATS